MTRPFLVTATATSARPISSCFRTQPTCNARYGKYLHTPGTARFQPIWRFWNWDSRHTECLLPEGSLRRPLNIGTRQTMRTATDRHSLLTGIMLNSNHPVHVGLLPEGGVSAGPSNKTGRLRARRLSIRIVRRAVGVSMALPRDRHCTACVWQRKCLAWRISVPVHLQPPVFWPRIQLSERFKSLRRTESAFG